MTIIGIFGICAMILTLVATCYIFSDSFLNQKTKKVRYYGYGNWKSKKKSL